MRVSTSDILLYSEKFNRPVDNLYRKLLDKHYSQREAKRIIMRAFKISLKYA